MPFKRVRNVLKIRVHLLQKVLLCQEITTFSLICSTTTDNKTISIYKKSALVLTSSVDLYIF